MRDLLEAIAFLNTHGLRGSSVIGGYQVRRVASLMARVLSLYGMTPGVQLIRTTLAQGLLHDSEVTQRFKEATGEADAMFPIPGHPMMRPDVGFIELSMGLVFRDSVALLPEHAVVRVANCAPDEQRKKKKDDKEKKRQLKQ